MLKYVKPNSSFIRVHNLILDYIRHSLIRALVNIMCWDLFLVDVVLQGSRCLPASLGNSELEVFFSTQPSLLNVSMFNRLLTAGFRLVYLDYLYH